MSDEILKPAEVAKSQDAARAEQTRRERRRLIQTAVASVPVVMTFTAGTARAQDASVKDSVLNSPPPDTPQDNLKSGSGAGGTSEESSELTPAEKLQTFGLERADRPANYNPSNPYQSLDSVHPTVNPNP